MTPGKRQVPRPSGRAVLRHRPDPMSMRTRKPPSAADKRLPCVLVIKSRRNQAESTTRRSPPSVSPAAIRPASNSAVAMMRLRPWSLRRRRPSSPPESKSNNCTTRVGGENGRDSNAWPSHVVLSRALHGDNAARSARSESGSVPFIAIKSPFIAMKIPLIARQPPLPGLRVRKRQPASRHRRSRL